jgi:hypothetical protein
MSNTSKITPYDDPNYESRSGSGGSKTAALTCTGAVAGAAGMALAATAAGVYGLYKVGRLLAVGRQPIEGFTIPRFIRARKTGCGYSPAEIREMP